MKNPTRQDITKRILNYLEYMEMVETGRHATVIRQTSSSITIEIDGDRYHIVVKKLKGAA